MKKRATGNTATREKDPGALIGGTQAQSDAYDTYTDKKKIAVKQSPNIGKLREVTIAGMPGNMKMFVPFDMTEEEVQEKIKRYIYAFEHRR